jgi:hypothetical protein
MVRAVGFEMPAQCYIIPAGQGAFPMKSRAYRPVLLALALAVCGAGLSHAAELERRIVRHRHLVHHRIVLPPERHVIEIVKEAYSDRFIINGARFAAKVPACTAGWLAGERVHFLSGEIHGFCADAVVYNAMRHRACEMWCGGPLFW